MDTREPAARLVLARSVEAAGPGGAWWPRSRVLGHEARSLYTAWRPEEGLISRVHYWPGDWDDCPVAVAVPGRRGVLRMGHLLAQDAHRVVLTMLDGQRHHLVVVPSAASPQVGARRLAAFRGISSEPPSRRADR